MFIIKEQNKENFLKSFTMGVKDGHAIVNFLFTKKKEEARPYKSVTYCSWDFQMIMEAHPDKKLEIV